MKLYRHWARADVTWTDAEGRPAGTAAYAGSDRSPEDAQARADALAQARARWVQDRSNPADPFGGYDLTDRPLREAVLWRQDDPAGQPQAALTRSRNGYVVLNATQLMIVDVDHLPGPGAGQHVRALWARLRGEPPPAPPTPLDALLRPFLRRHPEWSVRAYRTRAGYRLLVTHAPLDARDPASLRLMGELRADPLYVRLCRMQGCYRARLSPKPHRAGMVKPAQAYPYRDDRERAAQQAWEARYAQRAAGCAAAELVGVYGTGAVHPALAPLVRLHDEQAVQAGRPLA